MTYVSDYMIYPCFIFSIMVDGVSNNFVELTVL